MSAHDLAALRARREALERARVAALTDEELDGALRELMGEDAEGLSEEELSQRILAEVEAEIQAEAVAAGWPATHDPWYWYRWLRGKPRDWPR